MGLERGRCLFSLAILTGLLLDMAYGQNTTEAPMMTTTTAPTTDSATTLLTSADFPTTPDPCSQIECLNNGTCSTTTGTCICTDGWRGDTCSEDVDECKPEMEEDYPCDATNGNCTNTNGSYSCTCNPGFALDETDDSTCNEINECYSNPCQNGGTCEDMINGYTCTCLAGLFSGTNCEIDLNACDPDPCVNGNCTNRPMYPNDANYTCACSPGWMGRNCSEDIRECDDQPCYNDANCTEPEIGSYKCICTPGFNGTNCNETCPADTYGAYCVGSCTCVFGANCSKIDGNCTCDPVFDGAVCDKGNLMVTAMQVSPNDTISEGSNFTLVCQVNLARTDLEGVAWYRSGVELPNATDEEYFVDNIPEMGYYEITILQASAEDTGNYTCTAVTEGSQFTESSDVIVINVLVVGKIVDGPKEDRVRLNETAGLNCTAFSSESVTLAWEPIGQQLPVNRTTETKETGLVTPGGTYYSIILEVTGIIRADNGTYQCIVRDQEGNETDRGNFSIIVEEVPELSHPSYDDVKARELTIGWDEYDVNSATDNCTAFYNQSGNNETRQYTFDKPRLQGTIPDLTPHTIYSVSLICQNEVGPSERLMYPDNKTLQDAPEAPTNVTVSEVTETSAIVQWVAPVVLNGVLAGYTIFAERQQGCGSSCSRLFEDVDPHVLIYKMEKLSPGVEYKAIVRAFNRENGKRLSSENGGSSDEFRTVPTLPGIPDHVSADGSDDEHCKITWEAPQEPNGNIRHYVVTRETYRYDSNSNGNITEEKVTGLEWKRLKSELPPYSDFLFSVSAVNEEGEGDASEKVRCRNPVIGEPMTPAALEEPSAKSHYSFTTTFPTYNDRNGPVSCYEVVVVELQDPNAQLNSNDLTYSPENVKQYEDRGIGIPYIAIVKERSFSAPSNNEITIGREDEQKTNCNTGSSSRRRRSTTVPGTIDGVNGPLNPSGIYTSFVRVYSAKDEDEVFYENGPFMAAVELNGRPPNVGAIVGGIFGFAIALCLVIVIMLMYRRRKDNARDPLMSSTTNGPRENGNGTIIGMENLGIEDELIVKPIKLENLEKAIREKAKEEKRIFWEEYKALPNRPPPMVTMNNSNLAANKDKNRYINIIAYDHTRVKLKHIDGIEGSDYINASYVNGYQSPDKFIAAQGPKDNTLEDFWRMIWECNCSTIVMLTKCVEDGKDKCSQYWPDTGSVKFGKFEVKLDQVKETAEYVIRSFFLSENGKESGQRSISQFHFLGWPDHGQPDYPNPMLCLIKRVRHLTSKMNHRANIVVHCSAGVGRTGTYIVIDAMLDMMKHEKQVDIYNFIHDIRQQRNTLVQSFVQYFFIHIALLEEHFFGHMDVGMSDFPAYYQQLSNKSDINDDLTKLEEEFRKACKLGVNGTEQTYANIEQNKDKNRIGHILPFDKNIVKLERLIGEEFSDYINASYITGYDRKNMYIATQGPLPNTIADFWRMIWESQTSTIVMLTEITEKGHEMCAQYWPLEVDDIEEHGDISVTLVDESDEDEAFTIRDIEISHAHVMQNIYGNVDKEGEGSAEADDTPESEAMYGNVPESPPPTPMKDIRKIRQFHFRGWPEVGVPDSGIDLMHLVNNSHLHQKEKGAHPIVVHCSAGAGRTGVFIALNILMSRMEEESMIDVFQTVRGLRQQRPHMVQDLAQYKFCYLAMVEYIQDQSTEYQNFVPRV